MKNTFYSIGLVSLVALFVMLALPSIVSAEDYTPRYNYHEYSQRFNYYQSNQDNYYNTYYPQVYTPPVYYPPTNYSYNYQYNYSPAPISLPVYTYVPVYPVNMNYYSQTSFVNYYR